jgi:excisionase family DNA binding protein
MALSRSRVLGSSAIPTEAADPEPLGVPPRQAWRMLGCGNTTGYALLGAGELESYTIGRARRITTASIHRYIASRLSQSSAIGSALRSRRRGRSSVLTVEGGAAS